MEKITLNEIEKSFVALSKIVDPIIYNKLRKLGFSEEDLQKAQKYLPLMSIKINITAYGSTIGSHHPDVMLGRRIFVSFLKTTSCYLTDNNLIQAIALFVNQQTGVNLNKLENELKKHTIGEISQDLMDALFKIILEDKEIISCTEKIINS